MKPETEALLAAFEKAPLLSTAGQSLKDRTVVRCSSWDELEDPLVQHEANQILLYDMDDAIFGNLSSEEYDDLAEDLEFFEFSTKPRIMAIRESVYNHSLKSSINPHWVAALIWNSIYCACLEEEFSEHTNSVFYREIVAPWIWRGRLPCGWEGVYPGGKLKVF